MSILISSPFICSIPKALSDVQLELIDLQSNAVLAEHFKSGFCLGLFDDPLQVGSGLTVLDFVARPIGGDAEFEEFLDVTGHLGFLIWEKPDAFLDCDNVHAVNSVCVLL